MDKWDECDFNIDMDSLRGENIMENLTFQALQTLLLLF